MYTHTHIYTHTHTCEKIFSRAARSWIPTIVTPIGQAALPMDMMMYLSDALMYSRSLQSRTISARC